MEITHNITIEDLVNNYPQTLDYLSKKGIRCIRCGEAIWGTLAEAAREKGFDDASIDMFVDDLKKLVNE